MLSGSNPTVVIVGAGPIGLTHAWGIKKLNPNINVVVLEKYAEYQRKHTLIMEAKQLEKLMEATGTKDNAELSQLLSQLKRDPHISTSHLKAHLKKLLLTQESKLIVV